MVSQVTEGGFLCCNDASHFFRVKSSEYDRHDTSHHVAENSCPCQELSNFNTTNYELRVTSTSTSNSARVFFTLNLIFNVLRYTYRTENFCGVKRRSTWY